MKQCCKCKHRVGEGVIFCGEHLQTVCFKKTPCGGPCESIGCDDFEPGDEQ